MRYNYQGFFDINTLTKAYRYANEKHISKLSLAAEQVTADVDGSRLYSVDMTFSEGILQVAKCNCPLENGRCKHAAAILIFLDEKEIEKMQLKKG